VNITISGGGELSFAGWIFEMGHIIIINALGTAGS